MKTKIISLKKISLLFIALFGLFLSFAGSLTAQQQSGSKIVFLKMRLKDNSLTLLAITIRPGYLKQQRTWGAKGEILYKVFSASGAPVWFSAMEDPSRRRLEYEDPSAQGKIKVKEVEQNDVIFSVRIPYDTETKSISFYRLNEGGPQIKQKQTEATLLGSFDLSLTGKEK
jgi:hypothetical protein